MELFSEKKSTYKNGTKFRENPFYKDTLLK